MKRYQIYLNPQSIQTIDFFDGEIKLSRSAVIRLAVDALARNLALMLPPQKTLPGALDELIGIIAPSTKKTTNSALQVNEIYSTD